MDIQGLRAVAVVSVVVFHAFPRLVPGGFIGVDIFFVISGFLISSTIYRDVSTNRFSILEFYRRRIRRIFPALFAMLMVVIIVSYFLLSPSAYQEIARNTISSTLFFSNIDFFLSSGYFDRAAELRPLLHTWSLSVEEQFYIVFPVFVFVIHRYMNRLMLLSILVVGSISLALSQVAINYSPTGAYFLTPFRAFELLIGCSIPLIAVPNWLAGSRAARDGLSIAGLTSIAASLFVLSPATPFPGFAALLPTVGAAMIIFAGGSGRTLGGRAISSAPFVALGAVSYSFYLWHWPILSFLRIWTPSIGPTASELVLAVMAALAVATASYWLIERPFAAKATTTFPFLRFGTMGMVTISIAAFAIVALNGIPGRFGPSVLAAFAADQDISPMRGPCHQSDGRRLAYDATCLLSVGDKSEVVVWADSHGAELAAALSELVKDSGIALRQITASSCPPVVSVDFRARPNCRAANEDTLKSVASDPDVDTVLLLMNRSAYYFESEEDLEDGYRQVVDSLRKAGKRIVLIKQIPNMDFEPTGAVAFELMLGRDPTTIGPNVEEVRARFSRWNAFIEDTGTSSGSDYFDPMAVFCNDTICPAYRRDVGVLFFNETHPSMSGARLLASRLIATGEVAPAPTLQTSLSPENSL
ncbi:Peptidoglycan/LPS O-acetylase OafA/YrhL, contains acyltransferase and SGNH-hydrolase domains [Kaistia soli DSM 19436]|uniref:Peptidoglycan/LPS O-acetylase OafA/YrhL, contains acyltransferase and SGNH-hydrolase domains n=1 Tax=Kaistia soli DSM 19436 TaxID=1122133 RepID=A0A1M4YTX8_9HYPH|nr:Peptidoglycan/LPS O-acetylase OafA/YrhL, contains acyltransferase and SGNH-hydrolase domains [Kaistia soli DSM 19436]